MHQVVFRAYSRGMQLPAGWHDRKFTSTSQGTSHASEVIVRKGLIPRTVRSPSGESRNRPHLSLRGGTLPLKLLTLVQKTWSISFPSPRAAGCVFGCFESPRGPLGRPPPGPDTSTFVQFVGTRTRTCTFRYAVLNTTAGLPRPASISRLCVPFRLLGCCVGPTGVSWRT